MVNVPFIQRSVWIGEKPLPEEVKSISKTLRQSFKFGEMNAEVPFFVVENERVNCYLEKHANLLEGYSKDLKKNLRKEKTRTLRTRIDHAALESIIGLFRDAYGSLNPHLMDKHYKLFSDVTKRALEQDKATVVVVLDEQDNELLAGMVFWKGLQKYHYVLGAPTKEGRRRNALSKGLDYSIHNVLMEGEILDFEGSSIPSVRRFYNSFGGDEEVFYTIKVVT